LKRGASPYNKRIELTALGRHVFCLRKSHAGDAPGFDFPVESFRPCSQLIRELYGPRKSEMKMEIVWPAAIGEERNGRMLVLGSFQILALIQAFGQSK
jgi:hypothetical protein